jgi:hypothetical protein
MKALKVKQAGLMRAKAMKPKPDTTKYHQELSRHKQSFKPVKFAAVPKYSKSASFTGEQPTVVTNTISDASDHFYDLKADSRPESNLLAFIEDIEKSVPLSGPLPFDETERTWKSQLKTWSSALDDRIWTRKVSSQRVIDQMQAEKAVSYVERGERNIKISVRESDSGMETGPDCGTEKGES